MIGRHASGTASPSNRAIPGTTGGGGGRGSSLRMCQASDVERDADRAAAGMGADDRADLADHDLAVVVGAEHLDELVDVAAVGVEHGEVADPVLVLGDLVDEELECLRSGALLAALLDLAVDDLDDRLDRECGGEERLGVADPAALLQVLERVERTEDPGARRARSIASASTSSSDAAVGSEAGAGQRDGADAERDRAAVDDPDRDVVGHRTRGEFGALHASRTVRRRARRRRCRSRPRRAARR